jgi:DNA-binding transcriptional LysR family regulator
LRFVHHNLWLPGTCYNASTIVSICYFLIHMPATEPLETAELLAFSKTVEAKSLSRAAAELGVPRATLSRRLARLEQQLGVLLLRRTTRSLVLTDAGSALYRHARIVLDAVQQAEDSVRRDDDAIRGDLRISVPTMMGRGLNEMLCQFAQRHPLVRLHVNATSRHVDLRRDGYDVALRAGTVLEPGLIARTLAHVPVVGVASADYLAAKGTPRSLRDLRKHSCLLGFARGELPQTHWQLANGRQLHVEGPFVSNEITLLCEAARRGLGIAFLPSLLVEPFFADGSLVQVLPAKLEVMSQLAVVYPEREFVPPQVKALVAALASWAEQEFARR